MITPKDDTVLRAIKNLENNVSWKEIVAWIRESLFAQALKNINLSGEDAIKGQGRGQELNDLLKIITKADEYLHNK